MQDSPIYWRCWRERSVCELANKQNQEPDRIRSYFKAEKWTLVFVAVSGILYNTGMVAGPWFEGQLAQCLYDIIGGNKVFSDMLILTAAYVATILFVQTMRYVKRFYVRRFGNNVNRSMKRVLYSGLVHKSKSEMECESVGSLMTKAISDVDACSEGMRKFTTEIFDTGVVMIAYLTMLYVYDWRLALLSSIFPPFAYLIAEKLKVIVHRCTNSYKESASRLNSATLDRISGAITYRVFSCEEERDTAYEGHLADYEHNAIKANLWASAMQPLYQIISMLSVLFIIWFGAENVLGTGWSEWNIAAFTTFLSCFTKLAVKSSRAAKLFNAVQKAQVSWSRIKPMMKNEDETESAPVCPADLEVCGLSFSYPAGREILHNISFRASPGQIIGVTGAVACGKSTLGKVFLCEHPYHGSIRFAGCELASLSKDQRSGIFAYMGHQPELMSDTIEQNILLGDTADISVYLKAACLDREVNEMPDHAQTQVGSGGMRLSGGQQARVALARTLCHKRPVMILDDPFSAVDKATEKELYQNLRQMASDSIILLISHRLSLFSELDGVIWMENGHAAISTHEDLMRTNPNYAHLYRVQAEGGQMCEA